MFRGNFISKALHTSAKKAAPPEKTYQFILSGILPDASAAGLASYSAAASNVGFLSKMTWLRRAGGVLAAGAVTAAVSVALLASPSIKDVRIDKAAPFVQAANIVIVLDASVPVGSVAVIDEAGVPLAASLEGDGTYVMPITENGAYTIEAKGSNGNTASTSIAVDCIDNQIPEMVDYTQAGDYLYIRFYDAPSGVDWDSIYALDQDGNRIEPVEVRPAEALAVFALPKADLDLYIWDLAGNAATCVVSVVYK